jgi:hypothetical protein
MAFHVLTAMNLPFVGCGAMWCGYAHFGVTYRLYIRSPTLKMEVICSSETFVTVYKRARRHNSEDHGPPLQCRLALSAIILQQKSMKAGKYANHYERILCPGMLLLVVHFRMKCVIPLQDEINLLTNHKVVTDAVKCHISSSLLLPCYATHSLIRPRFSCTTDQLFHCKCLLFRHVTG